MQLRYTVQIKDTNLLVTQRRQLPPDKLQVAFSGQQSSADWKSLLTQPFSISRLKYVMSPQLDYSVIWVLLI